jgi:hypothetical protein|tara:strand:+ start:6952 stop:7395 length:444 start_codon:yes stop_codon:yes gene_type:complete
LAGAAESEKETIFPRSFRFEDTPLVFLSDFAHSGKRVDEGLFPAKGEEREVSARVSEPGETGGDAEFFKTADFFFAFVVRSNHFGEKFDPGAPVKTGAQTLMEAKGFADALHPEFGACGGKNEVAIALFVVLDFLQNFGVGEFWQPI